MRIRAGEWQKMNRGQKYIMILIAYGYWQGIWEAKARKTPAPAATGNGRGSKGF
jgi:hypothetical protein